MDTRKIIVANCNIYDHRTIQGTSTSDPDAKQYIILKKAFWITDFPVGLINLTISIAIRTLDIVCLLTTTIKMIIIIITMGVV